MRKTSLEELRSVKEKYLQIQELNNEIAEINDSMKLYIAQDLRACLKFIDNRIRKAELEQSST